MWPASDSEHEDRGLGRPITAADEERLWQHALHEDNGLLQRGNYFLVAESMLIVAFAGLLAVADNDRSVRPASTVIAAFGLLLTIAWMYVGHRHWKYVKYLQHVALDRLPYYQLIRASRPRNPVSTAAVMTWVVPIFAGLMWTLLLFIA